MNSASSVVKTKTIKYQLSIYTIFLKVWQQIIGLQKPFWKRYFLFIIIVLTFSLLFSYGVGTLSVYLKNSILVKIYPLLFNLLLDLIHWLLAISLIFLALSCIRNHPLTIQSAFTRLKKNWQSLILLGLLFSLFNSVLIFINTLLANKLNSLAFWTSSFHYTMVGRIAYPLMSLGLYFFCFSLPFIYVVLGMVMAMLLILDRKIASKTSLMLAFSAIKQLFFKNITLGLLEGLIFFISKSIVFGLMFFIGLQHLALKASTIQLLTFIFGLIFGLVALSVLSLIALISAFQYQQIFYKGESAFKALN